MLPSATVFKGQANLYKVEDGHFSSVNISLLFFETIPA